MSYIVQALRKLEQERRRVTVTEMTLFRGLSERWRNESPVWRYILVLSLLVNTGLAVWLFLFFSAGNGKEPAKINPQPDKTSMQFKRETLAGPYQSSMYPYTPMKMSLEVRSSRNGRTQVTGRAAATGRKISAVSRQRNIIRYGDAQSVINAGRMPQNATPAAEIDLPEDSASVSPNVLIWKDEKGNLHYSGIAGKD